MKLIISRSALIAHTRRHLEMDVYPWACTFLFSQDSIVLRDRRYTIEGKRITESDRGEAATHDQVRVRTPKITLQYLSTPLYV